MLKFFRTLLDDTPRSSPWWVPHLFLRTWVELQRDQGVLVASGLAFQVMIAVFPALVAGVSIWGFFLDPAVIEPQIAALSEVLPADARAVIARQLDRLAKQDNRTLGSGAFFGLGISLWGASVGIHTLVRSVSVAYGEPRPPNVFKLRILTFVLTILLVLFLLLTLSLVVLLPGWIAWSGTSEGIGGVLAVGRWPFLAVLALGGLAGLYRWAPTVHRPRWHSVVSGAVVALGLWLCASWLFSRYVAEVSHYGETYGALGGVVVFMLWLFVSGFAVLFGAEFCAQVDGSSERPSQFFGQ